MSVPPRRPAARSRPVGATAALATTGTIERIRDTITGTGGTVVTVVDHSTDAAGRPR